MDIFGCIGLVGGVGIEGGGEANGLNIYSSWHFIVVLLVNKHSDLLQDSAGRLYGPDHVGGAGGALQEVNLNTFSCKFECCIYANDLKALPSGW